MQNKFKEILKRHLLGSADKKQDKVVEDFVKNLQKTPLIDLKTIQENIALRNSIYSKIKYQNKKHKRIKNQTYGLFSLAAIACIVVLLLLPRGTTQTNESLSYYNSNKQSKSISLADGTLVELGSNSTLLVLDHFNESNREIKLIGEAFFNVAKDSLKPFIVHSESFKTQVLGTSFWIKKNLVEVSTGKVKVSSFKDIQNYVILKPTDKVWFKDNRLYKNSTDILSSVCSSSQSLLMNSISLVQWQEIVEKDLDVKIVISDKLISKDISIDADFRNSTFYDMLQSVSYLYDFDYKIENKTIIINNTKK